MISLLLLAGLGVMVSLIVLAVHYPAITAKAISFDDTMYLTDNPLVQNPSWPNAHRFLTEVLEPSTVAGYYQPLAMISLMLDSAMGGTPEDLLPYHRTSLILHVLNTMLVIIFLYLLFGSPVVAAAVGLLFGLHPMTVESIPWIGERKTLLAAFFALLSLIFYVRYARGRPDRVILSEAKNLPRPMRGSIPRGGAEFLRSAQHGTRDVAQNGNTTWRRLFYGICLLMYLLALMSKPITIMLPFVMILLDLWPLNRVGKRAILEKAPFLFLCGLFAWITVVSQDRTASTAMPGQQDPVDIFLVVCHNILFYPLKMICPINLTSHHPVPDPLGLRNPMVLAGLIFTALLIAAIVLSLRYTRALAVGWLIFFVAIFPTLGVIGFTNVVASYKYAYLPVIGLLMLIAWALIRFVRPTQVGWAITTLPLPGRLVIISIAVAVLAGLEARQTRRFLDLWQDTEPLYRHMIALAPRSSVLRYHLAHHLDKLGQYDASIEQCRIAIDNDPSCADAYHNWGSSLAKQAEELERQGKRDEAFKKFDEVIKKFRQCLDIRPDYAMAHKNLALAYLNLGRPDDAEVEYREAIKYKPLYAEAYFELGNAIIQERPNESKEQHRRRIELAIQEYRKALEINPRDAACRNNLASALNDLGQPDAAAEEFQLALRLDPRQLFANISYGRLLLQRGDYTKAGALFETAASVEPGNPNAMLGLATVFRKTGQTDQALSILRGLSQSVPPSPPPSVVSLFKALGDEFASLGSREEAAHEYRRALSFFEQYLPNAPEAADLRRRLAELAG